MLGQIEIFNPKDKPFGWLSNNYLYKMRLDGEEWKTATHYIYAKLLKNKGEQNIIRNSDISNISELTYKLINNNTINLDKLSYEIAYNELFKQQPELRTLLINTNNSPLVYKSNNIVFGINDKGEGKNLLGVILMQLRKKIQQEYEKEQYQENLQKVKHAIYELDTAYNALSQLIKSNKSNLEEYIDLHPTEIINRIGREKLKNTAAPIDILYQLYEKNPSNFSYLDPMIYGNDITIIAKLIRKNELRKLQNRLENSKKDISFDLYTNNILSQNFPNLDINDYEKAKQQQFQNITYQQLEDLKNRVYDLYKDRQLPEDLKNEIKTKINELIIPSSEEVRKAESFNPIYNKPVIEKQKEEVFLIDKPTITSQKEKFNIKQLLDDMNKFKEQSIKQEIKTELPSPIYIHSVPNMSSISLTSENMYNLLSPISNVYLIKIGEKMFPSIYHYVIFKRLVNIFGSVEKSYKYIKNPDTDIWTNIDELIKIYYEADKEHHNLKLEENAMKAMNKKFENRLLQDLLISTSNFNILYTDKNNNILGTGDKNTGANIVGKYLVILRAKIKIERSSETIQKLTEKDITDILENDGILKSWVTMRLNDMCNIIDICYRGLYVTKNIEEAKDAKFVQNVLDKVYNPCVYLYSLTSEVNAKVPQYFKDIVQNRLGGYKTVEIKQTIEEETLEGNDTDELLDKLIKNKRKEKQETQTKKEKVIVSDEIIDLLWKRIVVIIYYLMKIQKDMNITDIKTILAQLELLVSQDNIISCLDFSDCIDKALVNLIQSIHYVYNKNTSNPNILKVDDKYIELAISIILSRNIKFADLEKIEQQQEQDEGIEEIIVEQKDGEEEVIEEQIVEEEERDDEDDIPVFDYNMPKVAVKLNRYVDIDGIENIVQFTKDMKTAIEFIKKYKMSEYIKKNRINFFASR